MATVKDHGEMRWSTVLLGHRRGRYERAPWPALDSADEKSVVARLVARWGGVSWPTTSILERMIAVFDDLRIMAKTRPLAAVVIGTGRGVAQAALALHGVPSRGYDLGSALSRTRLCGFHPSPPIVNDLGLAATASYADKPQLDWFDGAARLVAVRQEADVIVVDVEPDNISDLDRLFDPFRLTGPGPGQKLVFVKIFATKALAVVVATRLANSVGLRGLQLSRATCGCDDHPAQWWVRFVWLSALKETSNPRNILLVDPAGSLVRCARVHVTGDQSAYMVSRIFGGGIGLPAAYFATGHLGDLALLTSTIGALRCRELRLVADGGRSRALPAYQRASDVVEELPRAHDLIVDGDAARAVKSAAEMIISLRQSDPVGKRGRHARSNKIQFWTKSFVAMFCSAHPDVPRPTCSEVVSSALVPKVTFDELGLDELFGDLQDWAE
jgi:hypothetical protein